MGAVSYRVRADLRRTWRGAAALALLVAAPAGAVLGVTAGARRTASAYPRMVDDTRAAEVLMAPPESGGEEMDAFYDQVADLPGVDSVAFIGNLNLRPREGSATANLVAREATGGEEPELGISFGSVDGRFGYEINRPKLLAGRMPDPDSTGEALASWVLTRRFGIGVGDVLEMEVGPGEDQGAASGEARPTSLRLEVTGVGVFANEVVPFTTNQEEGMLLLPPAVAALAPRASWGFEGLFIDVATDARPAAVIEDIQALAARHPEVGGEMFTSDQSVNAGEVQEVLRPLATALGVFAAVLAFVALLVLGQALGRHTREPAGDVLALRAVGVGRGGLVLAAMARATLIGLGGAAGAVALAVLLSPRFPMGPARVAEPHHGFDLDLPVLAFGAVAIVAACGLSVLPGALLRTRRRAADTTERETSGAVAVAARWGLPVPAVQGVRFALDAGRGPRNTPVRSTLLTAVAAVAAVLAGTTFAASLGGLLDTPSRYGQGWDRWLDGGFTPVPAAAIVERFGDDPRVAGLAVGGYGEAVVAGQRVPGISMSTVAGDVGVVVVERERADDPGEIVLGGEVLDAAGLGVGDRVDADFGEGSRTLLVVGRGVFPRLSLGAFDAIGLGLGAQFHPADLPAVPLNAAPEAGGDPGPGYAFRGRLYSFVALDVAGPPGALDDEFATFIADHGYFVSVADRQEPTAIRDLDLVRRIPVTLAAVLALVALAVLAHLLVSSVRDRRRDLAVLRTLGLGGRQLRATVRWHACVVAGSATLAGVPLGVACGRLLWRWFAVRLYVDPATTVSWPAVLLALPAALVAASALAWLPGRSAARTHPAHTLRRA